MEYTDFYRAVLAAVPDTCVAYDADDWDDFGLPVGWDPMCIIETADGEYAILFDNVAPESDERYVGVYRLLEVVGETDPDGYVFAPEETPAQKLMWVDSETEDMSSVSFAESEDGKYYADVPADYARTFALNIPAILSENSYDTLWDVTGQESGLVIYPDGGLIIGNWSKSRGYGVPIVSPFGGMMNYGIITRAKSQGEVNIKDYLADIDWYMVWDDNDILPSVADDDVAELWTVDATGGPLFVLAPEDWI